ncbi:MAG: CoA transferase [Rhodospirillaceae bacterium]|jgi:crotonobetainyl-CoA:carnitine CoA-transferase CaiB-like acyl-CoA transferase|nr:CoA transferase [Rhodospirillaceae bacterium]MBT6591280.1 CoA transferase [Rhodospirillaceae bacterium]MBT6977087.1 CoA transferase [Rhodospirillaceae bacterium]
MKDSLTGIEVLEIGVMTPGKFTGSLLVGWGARSLRVERPGSGSGTITDEDFLLNRGKRSMQLDLRSEIGRGVIHRLAARADVVIEGHRPGVAKRLGIDWETLRGLNQRLVYCAISGFGQDGPDRLRPGYDLIFQAATGLLQTTSPRGAEPGLPETFVADAGTGLAAGFAIAAALRKAAVEGAGTYIDLAMQDVAFSMLAVSHGTQRPGSGQAVRAPRASYNVYPTADGRHIAIGAARPASCRALFTHLGRADLAERGMVPGDAEAAAFLAEALAAKTAAETVAELRPLDIEVSLVRSPAEAFDDPQLKARGTVMTSEHPAAGPLRQINAFAASGSPDLAPAPEIGRDTDEILAELGYDKADRAALRDGGAA